MAIPVYLWLKDDGGADIKGSVDVQDREGSIEVVTDRDRELRLTPAAPGRVAGDEPVAGWGNSESDALRPAGSAVTDLPAVCGRSG